MATAVNVSLSETTWMVRAIVVRIVDGDTFSVELDLGWGQWRKEVKGAPNRVRILRYRAPERYAIGGSDATKLLASVIPPGTLLWIKSHALDSFGRALSDVYLMDGSDLLTRLNPAWVEP